MGTIYLIEKSASGLLKGEAHIRAGCDTNFIPRESIKIHPQSLDINLPMWRQRHPVDTQLRSRDSMHHIRDLPHIMDRPQHVARMCACH